MRQPGFCGLVFFVQLVQRVQLDVRDGEVGAAKNHQPRERKDEMKRQCHPAREVVQIQRAALRVLLGAKGEQLAKDLAVHDHTAHQRHQHHQRGKTHDPGTQVLPVQVEAVMQRVKKLAADLEVVVGQGGTRARVDGAVAPHRVFGVFGMGQLIACKHPQHRVAVGGVSTPAFDHRKVLRHGAIHAAFGGFDGLCAGFHVLKDRQQHLVERRHGLRRKARRRDRPAVNLAVEHRERAEEKNNHQHKAQHEAKPRVQPGHGEPEILKHGGSP